MVAHQELIEPTRHHCRSSVFYIENVTAIQGQSMLENATIKTFNDRLACLKSFCIHSKYIYSDIMNAF